MVHGIISKFKKPYTPSVDELGAVGAGTILGTANPLADLGFVGGPDTNITVSDTVSARVSRMPKPRGRDPRSNFAWPDPTGTRDKPKDEPVVSPIEFPFEEPAEGPPSFPPDSSTATTGEALRARDTLNVTIQRGTTEKPIIIKRTQGPTYNIRTGDAISYKGSHKKYYYRDHRGRLRRVPPCTALKNKTFDIDERAHRKTGNKSSRLRQIRRTYAYAKCA